jgi:RHS repeat-associated protein
LQPNGADGVDTYLLSSSPNANYGTSADMGIGENNNATNKYARSLIKFDLSSLPADANIVSATLSLWTSIDVSGNNSAVNVYRLKVPFSETQANWNRSATGINWQTAGAAGVNDRESAAIGSVQISASEPLNTEKQIALDPSKVQEMADGAFTNNGFLLAMDAELNNRFDFKTSDTTTASQRPMLTIQYMSPSSAPPPTPDPNLIFANGFESGDFSAWDWATTDGGDLSVSAQAAAVGTLGMQAVVDDNHEIVVYHSSINNKKHYSARFYFDPNSIQMTSADGFYLLGVSSAESGWVACLYFEQQGDRYSLSLCGGDDSETWLETDAVLIEDEWQAVEVEWKAATAPGANDGYTNLYLGDQLAASLQNIDNDGQSIVQTTLGISDGGVASGTMYFDAFESRTGGHIGLDPNGPVVSPAPARPDPLFADDFETGDLSRWNPTLSTMDAGDLSASAAAAYQGAYGLQALIDDTVNIKLVDASPADETHYRARFYLHPNSLVMASGSAHYIFDGVELGSGDSIIRLELAYQNGAYKLRPRTEKDDWDYVLGSMTPISNEWHAVEIEWKAASAPGTNDGFLSLWIDGNLIETLSGLDNDTKRLDQARLGVTAGVDSTTSGSMLFDFFESRRETYIGLLPAPATATPTPAPTGTATETPAATESPMPEETPTPAETPVETLTPEITETPATPMGAVVPDVQLVGFSKPLFAPLSDYSTTRLSDSSTLTITYTYDALNRLTSATYSDGRHFNYTYDANGNTLQLERDLGPGTVTTTYNYDAANQLNTAVEGSNTWQFTYDANGSLLSNGVTNYTYDSANRLIEVSNQSSVASMEYNGLGQRLSMEAAGVTTQYVMDGNNPLTADADGNVTTYLYGLGAVAEKTTAWNYALPDGSNTPRQLTDASGAVTLAARYTPWGDTLETYGTGDFTFGYFGGVMDAATGLLYVGNGQYYDPATGRFLTRDARPNQSNPYTPFDPMGALFAPLGVVALVYGRRRKGSKGAILLVILSFAVVTGLTLSGCDQQIKAQEIGITPTGTPMPITATATQAQNVIVASIATETQQVTATALAPTATLEYYCALINIPVQIEKPAGLNDYGERAYTNLQALQLIGNTQDALSQAVIEEYTPEFIATFERGVVSTDARLLSIAITRRYYKYCGSNGAWSASCLNGFWGYIQYAHNGHTTRCRTATSDNIAKAILNPGTSFGGLVFETSWSVDGCDGYPGGGYCHWANPRDDKLASIIKGDSQAAEDGSNSWTQDREMTLNDNSKRNIRTSLFDYGDTVFILYNEFAYSYYSSQYPEFFWQ